MDCIDTRCAVKCPVDPMGGDGARPRSTGGGFYFLEGADEKKLWIKGGGGN